MAELKCGACNCTYNQDRYCCKGDIMVAGRHADTTEDTCCDSFARRREEKDVYTSSLEHKSRIISIDCEAVKCAYNSNYKCIATHVDIVGRGANDSKATACDTFREK